jgi:hypothetical protein
MSTPIQGPGFSNTAAQVQADSLQESSTKDQPTSASQTGAPATPAAPNPSSATLPSQATTTAPTASSVFTQPATGLPLDPFGALDGAHFSSTIGRQVKTMMDDAMVLLNAKDDKGNPDQAKLMQGQHMLSQAQALQEMASKILQILADMQKTIIQNMR